MSVRYAAIACGSRILCEHSLGNTDYGQAVRQNLDTSVQEYVTFPLMGCTFNCLNVNGISYLCVTDMETSQQQTLQFLRKLQVLFTSDPTRVLEAQSGAEHCHQFDFGRKLSEEMALFCSQDKARLMELRSQVEDVSRVMEKNIYEINERGNRLDGLFEKTEQFESDAQMFQNTARRVKEKKYWENCRMRIFLFVGIFAIVLVILLLILWQSGVFDRN